MNVRMRAMTMRRPRAAMAWGLGLVVAVALAAGGCSSSSSSSAPAPVTLSYCGSDAAPSPSIVIVICNTDDITARDLSWTAWGGPTATASGVAVVDLCAYADCHTGSFGSVKIKLIATGITKCAGKRAYSTLRYVFPGGTPWPGAPSGASASHFMVGSSRPLPPANQTVALTCGS